MTLSFIFNTFVFLWTISSCTVSLQLGSARYALQLFVTHQEADEVMKLH